MVITSFIKSWWIVFKWVWEIKFPGVLGCFGFGKYLNGLKNKFKSLNYLWTLTPAKPCLPNDVGATNCGRGAGHVQIPGHGGKAEGVDVIDVGKTDTCHGWVVVLERKHVFFCQMLYWSTVHLIEVYIQLQRFVSFTVNCLSSVPLFGVSHAFSFWYLQTKCSPSFYVPEKKKWTYLIRLFDWLVLLTRITRK